MTKKILVVDDSATARALFAACLFNNPDYEVVQANGWEQGLAKAKEHQPFLYVLDYNMPEKTGADLAKLLIEEGLESYMVLLSANTQQSVVDEVKEIGFIDVLEKPVSMERIQSVLEKLQ